MIASKRGILALLLPLLLCSVVSCGVVDKTAPLPPQSVPTSPQHLIVWGYGWCSPDDGGFSDDECDFLQDAIWDLGGSSDPDCQYLADIAQGWLNSQSFTPGNGTIQDADMYVTMHSDGSTDSGWAWDGQGVFVQSQIFGHGGRETAALIAHEMAHVLGEDGPDHNTGTAAYYQTQCYNTMP